MKSSECYTILLNPLRYFTMGLALLMAPGLSLPKAPPTPSPQIGIIVPLEVESRAVVQAITDKKEITDQGIHYILGKIGKKDVVFALSGLGIINAAIVATHMVTRFHPDLMILSGSSGIINPKIKKGDVVIGEMVDDVDLGTLNQEGHTFLYHEDLYQPQVKKYLPLAFALRPDLIKFLKQLQEKSDVKFFLGKIATSDFLPNSTTQVKQMQKIKIDVVEMEGVSLMQVCWFFNKPCIVVRGASNLTSEKITHEDIQMAADQAAKVVLEIIKN